MNKLTEQYKKEKDKYNPLYWIGVIGVVVCIVLNVIFTKIILMVIALLFLSLLVFLDIRGAILVKEYKNLEKFLIEYKRLKRINDKEGLKELEDTLSERQRNRLECMKNLKSELSLMEADSLAIITNRVVSCSVRENVVFDAIQDFCYHGENVQRKKEKERR